MISHYNEDERKRLDAQFAEDQERMKLTLQYQWKEEGLKIGIEEGRQEGLQQGLQQGILNVARKMKAKALPIEEIADLTGLSIEEINKL